MNTERAKPSWICRVFGHKFKYTDQGLSTHVVDFCLRCGASHD